MTTRERNLVTILGTIFGLGGVLFLANQLFLRPLLEANKAIARLEDENQAKFDQVQKILRERPLLERSRLLSLPADPTQATTEYSAYLKPLLTKAGLSVDDFQLPQVDNRPTPPGAKKVNLQPLVFSLRATGTIGALSKALDALQKSPALHRIRNLNVERPESVGTGAKEKEDDPKLNILMGVEALIVRATEKPGQKPQGVQGADPRFLILDTLAGLRGAPGRINLASWTSWLAVPGSLQAATGGAPARTYADLARKNIFVGALPTPQVKITKEVAPPSPDEGIDVRKYVRLVTITHGDRETQKFRNQEAFLRYFLFPRQDERLCPSAGFDTFRIMNEDRSKEIVKGKVVKIDQREVYFSANGKIYAIHLGQTLADAMARPLSSLEIQRLQLVAEPASTLNQPTSTVEKKVKKGN